MAIAFDAAAEIANPSSSWSASWTHTVGVSGTVLIVNVDVRSPVATPVVTAAGLPMTLLGISGASVDTLYVFYLLNPPTGGVTISISVQSVLIAGNSVSYSGVGDIRSLNVNGTVTGGNTVNLSSYAVKNTWWLAGTANGFNTTGASISGVSSSRTIRDGYIYVNISNTAGIAAFDSNGTVSVGFQAATVTWNAPSAASGVLFFLSPDPPTTQLEIDTITTLSGVGNWSHSCLGSNRYLLVLLYYYCPAGVPSSGGIAISNTASLTYNGVALSCIKFSTGMGNIVVEAWALKNPDSGQNTLFLSQSVGDTTATRVTAISFKGADILTQPDSNSYILDGSGTGTSITMSPTASQAGDIIAGFYFTEGNNALSAWAITSGTVAKSISATGAANVQVVSGYLNSPSSGAGSQNFVGTWSGGTANFLDAGIAVSVNPVLNRANALFMVSD